MGLLIEVWSTSSAGYKAVRLSPDNLDAVAAWCGGNVKGIKRPPEHRVIDFYDQNQSEQRAECGDWLVRSPAGEFFVYRNEAMFFSAYSRTGV